MTDRREEVFGAALAEKLFAAARDDGVAIHPAVGVRIREQIEDALARRRSRSKVPRWIALAVAMTAVAVVWFAEEKESVPRIEPAMERLVRAQDRAVSIELAPGAQAQLGPGAALIPGIVPEVLEGEVEFRVVKLAPGESFEVRAADVVVAVTAATFRVRRIGAQVDVVVAGGSARIEHGTQRRVLRTGERWSTKKEQQQRPSDPPAKSRVERLLEESLERAAKMSADRDHDRPEAKPQGRLHEEGPPAVQVHHETHDVRSQEELREEEAKRRSLLELAAERLRAGDPDSARGIYRELAAGEPSGAALGLYLLARLEASHARRPASALAALDEFLARFSGHVLAAEAGASRIEALLELSRCAEAAAALSEFAARHPDVADLIVRSKVRYQNDCVPIDERSPAADH